MLLRRLIEAIQRPNALARAIALVMGATLLVLATKRVLGPCLENFALAGIHDWDTAASYRAITTLSIKRFHELPWYHPYLCGGFPAWAYGEGAPNLVSIFLPFYLALPVWSAIRFEIIGCVLISMTGAFALSRRYTQSIALCVLVAATYTLNGRWALQMTAGHSWHLQYAWVPWALFFYDIACERGRLRWAALSGVALAMSVYSGGLYPTPHAALLMVLWTLLRTPFERSFRPFASLAIAGVTGIGFAAPKLLCVIDLMTRFTRKIDSTEAIGLNELGAMLAAPNQSMYRGVAPVPAYGWHEWGHYVGWPMCIAMLFALLFSRGSRQTPLKFAGLVFMVLSLGAFADKAPWTLLHKLPVFASQHVPSRFMYLSFLCLAIAFAAWLGERLQKWGPGADILLFVPVWFCVMDVAEVSRNTTTEAFMLETPKVMWHRDFKQITRASYDYNPPGAWAGPSEPMIEANEGFIGCYSVPDRADPKGAIASDAPGYKGEVYFEEGSGHAAITDWSPNHAVVEYADVTPGSVLVYNMNWDTSWSVNGQRAIDYKHAVAVKIDQGGKGNVRFSYFPRMLVWGLLVCFLTIASVVWGPRAWTKMRARFS